VAVDHAIRLSKPRHYVAEYEQAIAMLSACTDTEVTLDSTLHGQLVEDRWEWKDEFSNSTLGYTAKASISNEPAGV
jgi:hypothetical protein